MARKKEEPEEKDKNEMTTEVTSTQNAKLERLLDQKRKEKEQQDAVDPDPEPSKVSLGPAGAIVDALLNTAPGHMLELTDFDRNQVSLVPQVVVIDDFWDYIEQVTAFREDKEHFFSVNKRRYPEIPDTSRKFVFTLAQTRRSLGGKMKKALEDMALAELETKGMDDNMGEGSGHDQFGD